MKCNPREVLNLSYEDFELLNLAWNDYVERENERIKLEMKGD
ncbi:hypothetical protein [Cetobacterium ceti]|nr:hypothetical protein [Cetobacterium ceti]